MAHSYTFTPAQARMFHQQVSSHCATLKNWIVTAVEGDKIEYAMELAKELREYQKLYAATNVDVHEMIDKAKNPA
jgi:uncharacterized protein YaeQ